MISLSLEIHARSVVEVEAYSIITNLASLLRIAQSLTLLPLDTAINRGPFISFQIKVVVKALRGFPLRGRVALSLIILAGYTLLTPAVEIYLAFLIAVT